VSSELTVCGGPALAIGPLLTLIATLSVFFAPWLSVTVSRNNNSYGSVTSSGTHHPSAALADEVLTMLVEETIAHGEGALNVG
jgi:hypothetical protein